jgi:Icc protein
VATAGVLNETRRRARSPVISVPKLAWRGSPRGTWRAPAWPLEVFALDDESVQFVWRGSPGDGLRIEVGDRAVSPEPSPRAKLLLSVVSWRGAPGGGGANAPVRERWPSLIKGSRVLDPAWPAGPGAAVVEGLSPGTTYEVTASAEGLPRFLAGHITTLRRLEGELLFRLATVTDLHIGERHFGVLGRLWDALGTEPAGGPYPARCLRAALDEALAWGAELVVSKGDLTRVATAAELRDAARMLASLPVPVETVLGNHDNALTVDMHSVLEKNGLWVPWGPRSLDVPGLRVVLANTLHGHPRYHRGHLPPEVARRVASLAGGTGAPAMVVLHHPPELNPFPTVYPPGIPLEESRFLLDALAAANERALLTCGHRHRNRRYRYGPVVVAETGSTKDYPGGWAGYKIYEGGIVQVARRTMRTDVIGWTEATRRAMNGQWGRWSPGRLSDRCWALGWG